MPVAPNMTTKRPLDSGRRDSQGRTIRIAATNTTTRSNAPTPDTDDSARFAALGRNPITRPEPARDHAGFSEAERALADHPDITIHEARWALTAQVDPNNYRAARQHGCKHSNFVKLAALGYTSRDIVAAHIDGPNHEHLEANIHPTFGYRRATLNPDLDRGAQTELVDRYGGRLDDFDGFRLQGRNLDDTRRLLDLNIQPADLERSPHLSMEHIEQIVNLNPDHDPDDQQHIDSLRSRIRRWSRLDYMDANIDDLEHWHQMTPVEQHRWETEIRTAHNTARP